MDKKVIVEYKTQQDYCDCCGQKIEKPKTSKTKEFHISKYDCYSYLSEDDWKIESENIVKTDLKSNIGIAEMSLDLVKILLFYRQH